MWKLRIGALVTCWALALGLSSGAWADGGAGEVWLGNAGAPPAHTSDPRLACQDLELWGAGLPDTSGAFTIEAWSSPTSHVSYLGTWAYTQSSSRDQDQVIAVVDVPKLISQVEPDDGLHLQLDFAQHPEMDKTFSISCGSGSAGGSQSDGGTGSTCHSGGGTTAAGGGATPSGGGSSPGGSQNSTDGTITTAAGTVNTPAVTTTSAGPVKTSIGAITASRPKAHKARKRRRLVRSKRQRKVQKRHVKAVSVRVPTFTG